MSPYYVLIDSLYFHVMTSFLLQDKQTPLLPLRLQKHEKYDPKKIYSPSMTGQLFLVLTVFFVYIKRRRNTDKN